MDFWCRSSQTLDDNQARVQMACAADATLPVCRDEAKELRAYRGFNIGCTSKIESSFGIPWEPVLTVRQDYWRDTVCGRPLASRLDSQSMDRRPGGCAAMQGQRDKEVVKTPGRVEGMFLKLEKLEADNVDGKTLTLYMSTVLVVTNSVY